MIKANHWFWFILFVSAALASVWLVKGHDALAQSKGEKLVRPFYGEVEEAISSSGTVQPQNRLEIKPSINGRLEEVLVREGDMVKKGAVLAWMSSTDRAALLDAAMAKGAETAARWKDVYKATPLMAPIDGQVIVRGIEPGQSVTTASVVLVLSDRLGVKAQVDETDIGRVKVGMPARVALDAYPDIKVTGRVGHVAYESTTVNNVTVYAVDIITDTIPDVFRSGMNANIDIVETKKQQALLIPAAAVKRMKERSYVMVRSQRGAPEERNVSAGLTVKENVEILSGLSIDDEVILSEKAYVVPVKKAAAGSPLAPNMPKMRRGM